MDDAGKEGVLFDSFSESNSKEGSLRAGNNLKPLPLLGARLQACLEDVAAARKIAPTEPGSRNWASFRVITSLQTNAAVTGHARAAVTVLS